MQYSDSKINPEYKQLSELPLNRFDYKGYYTLIHFDSEDKVLYGKIEGIDDLVTQVLLIINFLIIMMRLLNIKNLLNYSSKILIQAFQIF